jgi:G:T-mismatch repair DNA endonuclease (very short patch repair protein)
MDRFDATKRSAIMLGVRSKDTEPEMAVRSALHARGLRFRLNAKLLAGRHDIVLPTARSRDMLALPKSRPGLDSIAPALKKQSSRLRE